MVCLTVFEEKLFKHQQKMFYYSYYLEYNFDEIKTFEMQTFGQLNEVRKIKTCKP